MSVEEINSRWTEIQPILDGKASGGFDGVPVTLDDVRLMSEQQISTPRGTR